MDLRDSPPQAAFRAGLRAWLRANLPAPGGPPPARDTVALRRFSELLHTAGYAGLTWPVQYGGRGLAPAFQAIYAEESALAEAPDQLNVIGLNMVGPTLIAHGTPAQRERYLPGILSGTVLFCQGFSEPDAGSDLAAVRTRAVGVPGGYRLHGEKVWSSYAHLADHCLLLARTGPAGSRHHGLTCFLLDLRAAGVTVAPLRQLSGDTDFNQIRLDDVAVADADVVGEVGGGWRVAMATLAHERGTFGVTLTARLSVVFDRLLATVRHTGRASDPRVRHEVAAIYTVLQGLRHTGYRALGALAATGEPGPESSVLKLVWSATNQRIGTLALELLGGAAALDGRDALWGGYWQHHRLRSRANSIEGGTSEILRSVIAERVLRLPRSR